MGWLGWIGIFRLPLRGFTETVTIDGSIYFICNDGHCIGWSIISYLQYMSQYIFLQWTRWGLVGTWEIHRQCSTFGHHDWYQIPGPYGGHVTCWFLIPLLGSPGAVMPLGWKDSCSNSWPWFLEVSTWRLLIILSIFLFPPTLLDMKSHEVRGRLWLFCRLLGAVSSGIYTLSLIYPLWGWCMGQHGIYQPCLCYYRRIIFSKYWGPCF